ncbi:response regulator [uncultured Aquimarina sp.]|uniref:LytR/AlgR family response regulator transcription factor n=1 Tax=uncultured Aquimarina sp. TaxID=575652 RepID=UPI00261E2A66|nr:response regulator [uncultured Aquimarina sp.]
MQTITAIVIDDELSARNVLSNLLSRTNKNIEVITTCGNLEEGVEQIKKFKPDVVFLDVQMPNYAGYEIVRFFDVINFEIIFVTAFNHYAIKAFELNAIDYLVKPIERSKLDSTIEKIEVKLKQKSALTDYNILLKSIKEKDFNKIVIPELGDRRIVNLSDILAIQAEGAYSKLLLIGNKTIIASKNLKYFEEILPKDASFFRAHRTWIVNLDHVELLNKTAQTITMIDQTVKVKISRTRIEAFQKKLSSNPLN